MKLTINQIILLLDIYRGIDTQSSIKTYNKDLNTLIGQGYVNFVNTAMITERGALLVEQLIDLARIKNK